MPGTLRSLAFEAVPQLGAKCASKRSSRSASANLQTVLKSCGLVKSNDATGKFSALLVFVTANTLKPSFCTLYWTTRPGKISKIKLDPCKARLLYQRIRLKLLERKLLNCKRNHMHWHSVHAKRCTCTCHGPKWGAIGPGTTSWWLHPHLKPFLSTGSAFRCSMPGLRHFIQSCMPNLHLPPLTGLLQPLDMLKCQHIGFPASVFRAKPVSSSGNWGAGLSAGLGRLKGFFGTGLGMFGSGSNGLFGGCCAVTLGIAIKWTLILGPCINLSKALQEVVCPCGGFERPCVPMPKSRKFPCLLASLESRWWHWSCWGHQKLKWTSACPTTFDTRSMTANSRGQTLGGAFVARNTTWAPCWCQCPANSKSPSASRPLVPAWSLSLTCFLLRSAPHFPWSDTCLGAGTWCSHFPAHCKVHLWESEQVVAPGCAVTLAVFSSAHRVCFASLWTGAFGSALKRPHMQTEFHLSYKEAGRLKVQTS